MREWPTFEQVLREHPTVIPGVEVLAKEKGVTENEAFLQINAESFRRRGDALDIPYLAGLSNMSEANARRILGMETRMTLGEAKMIATLNEKYPMPDELKDGALKVLEPELSMMRHTVARTERMVKNLKNA